MTHSVMAQHNDTQHNDTQQDDTERNDIQQDDIQHNDSHYNDTQHNYTKHNGLICDTQHKVLCCYAKCRVLSIVLLNVIMVNVIVSNVMAPLDYLPLDVTFPEPINLDFSRLKKTCLKVFYRFTAGFISF